MSGEAAVAEALRRHQFWPSNGRDQRRNECSCRSWRTTYEDTEEDHQLHVAEAILSALTSPYAHATQTPFTLRMPTNRADNPGGGELNVGTQHVDVQVILDPDMDMRGECRHGYGGPVIALREWNEQVFLHELLHAVVGYAQPLVVTTHPPHGHEVISRIEVALWETGWRMTAPTTLAPTAAQQVAAMRAVADVGAQVARDGVWRCDHFMHDIDRCTPTKHYGHGEA